MLKTYDFTTREALYRTYDVARLRAAHADAYETLLVWRKGARDANFEDAEANSNEGYYTDDCATLSKIIAEKVKEAA